MKIIITMMMSLMTFTHVYAQEQTRACRADDLNQMLIEQNPEVGKEFNSWQTQVNHWSTTGRSNFESSYVIPVVFHVFGTDFAGKSVTDEIIETALSKLNDDFNGRNDDFDQIDPLFDPIKQSLDITFALAKLDPEGNETTGIEYYDVNSGFGNDDTHDSQIVTFAWDNYQYMNVYIMLDLYADNDHYNSGVAWYPSTYMSNRNTARVVYNGRYLHGNTNKEFASTLSHEFGHWLDLRHTFNGGCTFPNDLVDDTPPVDESGMGCRNQKNCQGNVINGENYMDYNTTCYKMFTQGQVDRMLAALQHPTRRPLWQEDNLIETGVLDLTALARFDVSGLFVKPGEEISFVDQSRTADNTTITTWSWQFPGAQPASFEGQNPPPITYDQDGVYEISLSIVNSNGDTHSRVIEVTVESYFTISDADEITVCDGVFYDGGLQNQYPSSSNHVMTIHPGDPGTNVKIDFTQFALQSVDGNGDCAQDYLEVFDGTSVDDALIGKYCGYENVPLSVKASNASGALTIRFVSDDSGEFAGWRGLTFCESKDDPIPDVVMASGEYLICEGTFFDPGKRMDYRNGLDVWTTLYPEVAGSTLTLDFEMFDFEAEGCEFDYLEVFDGSDGQADLIGKYCGSQLPGAISSTNTDGALTVHLVTDDNTSAAGWIANVTCIENQGLLAGFISNSRTVCPGQSVQFEHNSSGEPEAIEWSFEGGTPAISTENAPTVVYQEGGIFEVSLTVTKGSEENTKIRPGYITVKQSKETPLTEGFAGDFPPAGWSIVNNDGALTWEQRSDFGYTGPGCLVMNNADNANEGTEDDMLLLPIDISELTDPVMTFYVAYTKFNDTSPDRLDVWASDDCGETLTKLWSKDHHALETVEVPQDNSNDWTPVKKSDWRQEVVELLDYAGNDFLELRFKNTSGYGTRIWIDDVTIGERSDIVLDLGQEKQGFSVIPTYGEGTFRLLFAPASQPSNVRVTDMLGKVVLTQNITHQKELILELSNFKKGLYLISVTDQLGKRTNQKVIMY